MLAPMRCVHDGWHDGWIACIVLLVGACSEARSGLAPEDVTRSDARAVELAHEVTQRLGGAHAWRDTRYVTWNFFGRRRHVWERATGRVRIEFEDQLVLMNVHDKTGRAWRGGAPLTDPDELAQALEQGYGWWINDSYWMFMPYKLFDPGVTLTWVGASELEDGRSARAIDLTFDAVGLTPENRYRVHVDDDGLVAQWDFYQRADDDAPTLSMPWSAWQRFGTIELATDHGRGADWAIAVPQNVPDDVFTTP